MNGDRGYMGNLCPQFTFAVNLKLFQKCSLYKTKMKQSDHALFCLKEVQ